MWNESLILTRLTQAKKFLEGSALQAAQGEDFSLWQIRIRTISTHRTGEGGVNDLEIAYEKASEKEDESSFGVKFLLGALKCPDHVVSYSAVKALVALSEFLRHTRKDLWPTFLLALWKDAQHWVARPEPSSLPKSQMYWKAFLQNGNSDFSSQTQTDACLIGASNSLQTLQQSLKRCYSLIDQNTEAEVPRRKCLEDLEIFLCLLTTRVDKVTTAICAAQDEDMKGLSRELVLGALLRLLCTGATILRLILSEKSRQNVSCGAYLDLTQVLIPIISRSALGVHKNCEGRRCISPYLRHKLLMFMLKLSDWFDSRPSLAVSCYTAFSHFGSDLLDFSLQMDKDDKISSDESPFAESLLASSTMGVPRVPSIPRLQRRALILLFKVSDATYPSADDDSIVRPAKRSLEQLYPACTCKLSSRVYLRDWMKKQYHSRVCGNTEDMLLGLSGICGWVNELATKLIQLYLEEDDFLFMMMMQLLNMPFLSSIFTCLRHPTEDMFCRIVVEAFVPARLFRAFLTGIRFDHTTIEKLLISKTTGILCLTYLMRSLRYVSESWPEFIQKSPCAVLDDLALSRSQELEEMKIPSLWCTLCSYEHMSRQGLVPNDQGAIRDFITCRGNEQEVRDSTTGDSVCGKKRADRSLLLKVTECLRRLKVRIEDTNEHAGFPYNPTPLLKRLTTVVDLLDSHFE
ncbi:hypothetical protein R1flu_012529 [Riccia fluitans]|uniref:Protein Lines N-terminal domain-containing protein n=1 Tax=Riccia fluitans TaxID=41844 RepID=A0ABD1ZEZ6_9MARC